MWMHSMVCIHPVLPVSNVICTVLFMTFIKIKIIMFQVYIQPIWWSKAVRSQRWAPKLQPPHASKQKWSMTKVGGAWKIWEWKERKVCSGPSAETQHDQLRWRGWMRPFTGSNERVPAAPWMRVGPFAPHRRAQTSDLENYPGSTLGQSPQQQAGVRIVTRHFNQCLAAPSTGQSFSLVLKELSVKSALRDSFFIKGSSRHLWEMWDWLMHSNLFVLARCASWVYL